jgi:hypothetical protein
MTQDILLLKWWPTGWTMSFDGLVDTFNAVVEQLMTKNAMLDNSLEAAARKIAKQEDWWQLANILSPDKFVSTSSDTMDVNLSRNLNTNTFFASQFISTNRSSLTRSTFSRKRMLLIKYREKGTVVSIWHGRWREM